MKQVKAQRGDRLDMIVYQEYKTLSVFKNVLECNRHLNQKPILEEDDIVNLPNITIKSTPKAKKLW